MDEVKRVVDMHLHYLIENHLKVATIQEYWDYLKLPRREETLRKRRDHLDHAIRHRESP